MLKTFSLLAASAALAGCIAVPVDSVHYAHPYPVAYTPPSVVYVPRVYAPRPYYRPRFYYYRGFYY